MQLGFHDLKEEEQKKAKDHVDFHKKTRSAEMYLIYVMMGIWAAGTCFMGIKAISDRSYLSRFLESLIVLCVTCGICFGWKYFLNLLFEWVFKRQNTEKLPKQSMRSLKHVLSNMGGNIALLIWEIFWGIIAFSAIFAVSVTAETSDAFHMKSVVGTGGKMLLIFLVGCALFQWIHRRRDLTKRLLKNTVDYYDYGDGTQYAAYVDRSLRENMLLCCKQYVLTKEIFLGYAHTDIGFYPVAIPREFVKEAEVRMALSADSKVSVSKAVLACKLCNGKVIDFYLSRYQGSRLAVELLQKHGLSFTVRNDVVEYQ